MVHQALCFGITVSCIVWSLGHASGAHINPAVTLSMLVTRRMGLVRAVLYVVTQCAGAGAGAAVVNAATYNARVAPNVSLGLNLPYLNAEINKEVSPLQAVGIEIVLTFFLVLVIFATCDCSRTDLQGSRPLTIGLTVTALMLAYVSHVAL